jgi:hypothetical protein
MRSHQYDCTCGTCYRCKGKHYHTDEKCGPAGKGTTALGIIGTVLGGAALLGEGVLGRRGLVGGYEGGHRGGCGEYGHKSHMLDKCSCLVDKFELAQSEKIARLEAILEKEKAEKFAIERDERILYHVNDKHGEVHNKCDKANDLAIAALEEVKCLKNVIRVTEDKNAEIASIKDKLVEKEAALMDSKLAGKIESLKKEMVGGFDLVGSKIHGVDRRVDDVEDDLNNRISGVAKAMEKEVALEAERRKCADNLLELQIRDEIKDRKIGDREIYAFCDCNFIKSKKYIPCSEVGRVVCCGDEDEKPRRGRPRKSLNDNDGNIVVKGNRNTITPTITNTPTVTDSDDDEVGIES